MKQKIELKQRKPTKPKISFFKKINKIDKLLEIQMQRNEEKALINNTTTNLTDIKRIMKGDCKQILAKIDLTI